MAALPAAAWEYLPHDLFSRTWEVLEEGSRSRVASAFAVGLWDQRYDHGYLAATGVLRTEPEPALPVEIETPFDLASLTKVLATTALAAVLLDRGWIGLDLPVRAVLPEFPSADVTVFHLLTHTSGQPAHFKFYETLLERFGGSPQALARASIQDRQREMRRLVLKTPLEAAPGSRCLYSDLSFLTLGFLMETILQRDLDRAVRKYVWEPLGLSKSLRFIRVKQGVEEGRLQTVAATEKCPWRGGVLQGQVHDDNCWAMGGYAGHAGAFGTIRDVMEFLRGWTLGNRVSPDVRELFWREVPGIRRTLGWDMPSLPLSEASVGERFSAMTVGHLGFTGTSLWMDREAQVGVALLTNRVHFGHDPQAIRAFRPRFHTAIRLDLDDLRSRQ